MNKLKEYAGLLNEAAPKNHFLAYITEDEKDMLVKAGGQETATISGILAYPPPGERGGGVIVMIASIWGRESGGRMTYNAVKSAEISLAKSLAQQLASDSIRVNSIAPGSISFPGGSWHRRQQEDPEGMKAFVSENLPFGRFGHADEVGSVVAFLASDRASWISGACVTVDGCQSRALF